MTRTALVPVERTTPSILIVRGQRVLLDSELATLYDVTTKALNQAVKRNAERFPEDFMFRLSHTEAEVLNRSQSVTGSQKHRDPRFPPFAFTEHGAILAASILNSARAVEMSLNGTPSPSKWSSGSASAYSIALQDGQLHIRLLESRSVANFRK
jgi:hypothetical protein